MTQKEFEQLTGKEITAVEYDVIERVYMSDDSMDKQTFCKMWTSLTEQAKSMMINLVRQNEKVRNEAKVVATKMMNEKERMLDVMFNVNSKYDITELRDCCIEVMGRRDYAIKVLKNREPDDDERSLIVELLQEQRY